MEFAKLINLNPNPRAPCSEHTVCYTVVLACFPTRQHNLLHFIHLRLERVDQLRSGFEEIIALPTSICIGFSFTAPWHEICCPGLSRRFTCSVYAQDVFLAIFLEGFADVISIDFLHPCCFGLRGSTVLPPSFIFATCLYNHWASTR